MTELVFLGWYAVGLVAAALVVRQQGDILLAILAASLGPVGLAVVLAA